MKKRLICTVITAAIAWQGHAQSDHTMEHIEVIAPMHSPLDIKTDPKATRQPLPAQDGADLLSSIAGFSLVKKGGASSDPVFRGMAGSRINIITDGGVTLGGCGGRMDPPTAYITPQTYDTLTVIKGPQTVLYGPGNSAATVVFERESERLLESGTTGFINTTIGTFGKRVLNSDIKTGTQDYFARVAASYSEADDYQDGDGTHIHSAYEKWNLDSQFAYTPDDSTLYSVSIGRSDGEVAYADRMMDGSLFDRTQVALQMVKSELDGFVTSIEANVFFNDIDHIMDNHSLRQFMPNMMMKTPVSSNPDRRTWGGKILLNSQFNDQISLAYGLDHQQNRHRLRISRDLVNMPVESMVRLETAKFEQTGLFAEVEYSLGQSSQWVSGLRIDDWEATDRRQTRSVMMQVVPNPTADLSRSDTLISGFTRYQAQSKNSSYYIGVGRTERFPDYWELMGGGRGAVDSPSAFLVDHETTDQLDIGWLGQSKSFTNSVSVFINRIDNYLLTDNLYEKMGMISKVTRNIDAQTYGFEAESRYNLTKNLVTTASINYVKGENRTDDVALAQQPPLQVRFALSYIKGKWQFGSLWRIVQKQHRVAIGQGNIAGQDVSESHGFGTLALNTSYSHNADLVFNLGVDNVFDKTYAEHLSRSGTMVSGYPQTAKVNEAGRTLWLNMNWKF
ncbi:TonB-dependent copper receptor [Pseudoalteromonas luteoviolacea]|uniref:TonB-dependent copper receptor n=1 Tax=Pseudoalteromonas luteoviolacea TaxID=43657 RepID=UPI001B35CF54|nr:TonB-dependent copper receptor [Pseudoalteromonas luteoviolacea]MBQ4837060.1 TonB-dependent copper receptor [Pseudoalteromonas luteoviolacea]